MTAPIKQKFVLLSSRYGIGGIYYGLNNQTITGNASGAWAIAANGTNQNITLTPSGTGGVGINGTPFGGEKLQVRRDGGGIQTTMVIQNRTTAAADLGSMLVWAGQSDANMGGIAMAWTAAATTDSYLAFTTRGSSSNAERARITASGVFLLGTTADSSNGRLQLTSHTSSAGGIGFGTDVVLYRSAADTLTTDDTLVIGGALIGGVQALSGAGAVNITQLHTSYTSTGAAQALTLANGASGQVKTITHTVDGGSGVLTPTTAVGYTTITFTNAGDSVTLRYTAAGWAIVGIYGAVAA